MSSVSLKGASSDRNETKQSLAPPPPVPALPLGEKMNKQSTMDNKLDVAMPDLRFSRLDLEAHVQAIGQDKRQSGASLEPFSPKVEQRKSRLGFFGGKAAVASSDELAPAQKANRASALLGSPQMAPPSKSISAQNLQAPKVDRQAAPKTGYNTMPRSSTAGQALYAKGQMSPPPNPSPKPVVVDKKQQKKDEKLKIQQEKERMKQLAKEMKEQEKLAKRASKISLKASKSDLKSKQQPSSPAAIQSPNRREKSPKRAEQQRPLQVAANPPPLPRTPEQRNIRSNPTPQVEHRSSPVPQQQAPVQQAPRTPIQQAPRTPVQQAPRTPVQSAPRSPAQSAPRAPTQPLIVLKKQSPAKVLEPYDPIRFPNPYDAKPASSPSQRKDSQSEESGQGLSNSDSFTHPQAMLPSTTFSSDVPANGKVLMTTSSSEGGTGSSSTADERRQSSESNTSVENNSTFGSDEQFTDAAISIPPSQSGGRPTRDTEREELVQSRLSMSMDGGLYHSTEAKHEKLAETDNTTSSSIPKLPAINTDVKPNDADLKHVHKRVDSNASTFSAMLMASRPGGSADRAVDAKPAPLAQKQQIDQYRAGINKSLLARSGLMKQETFTQEPEQIDEIDDKGSQPLSMLDHASSILRRVREAVPNMPQRQRTVQPELVAHGDGWSCMGVGDVDKVDSHWHTVIETIKVARIKEKEENNEEEEEESSEKDENEHSEPEIEYVDEEVEAHYNDLFELLFTSTTPDVISTLLSYLDIHDIKALRQTSAPVRLAVGANRELILNQFLSGIGYRTWTYVKGSATAARARLAGQSPITTNKDPCLLSLSDLEGFIIAQDLLPEYAMVGQEFARAPEEMDQGMARLARATTRAHNRVLTRLRLQPTYKVPNTPIKKASYASTSSPSSPSTPTSKINSSTSFINRQMSGSASTNLINRHNSYYDFRKQSLPLDINDLPPVPSLNLINEGLTPAPSSVGSHSPLSPGSPALTTAPSTPSPLCESSPIETVTVPTLVSPWKPGRAATFRVWVPAKDPSGWLSDAELAECEQELYKSGVWQYLKRGDIIWDTAVGDQLNEGKYVFDGHYLRDLSYGFDAAGHLPSWLNVIMFSPSYWHNVIKSTKPQPVVYLDIAPWKDQILNSLRLVQDHVDTFSGNGARYRIAKWLYRSAANVTSGQIISRMNGGLEIVDDQWAGRIVIETDGTAEWAKELVNRCAGPEATAREKASLLATVMGDANEAGKLTNIHDTNGGTQKPALYNKFGGQGGSTMIRKNVEPQNEPWAIMRERCRPGLIWIRPLGDREKVFA
ncbi:hypothetical protein L7F22_042034 [Adiantum nelumboides]|nr:hypothetical protein [Adiantum nelumboides]